MRKPHLGCRQQQTLMAEQDLEQAVMPSLAVGRVADDGMRDVFHVPAQLVPAAAKRFQFDQRVPAAGVAIDPMRQLHRGQPTVSGLRWLCRSCGDDSRMLVRHAGQRMIYFT